MRAFVRGLMQDQECLRICYGFLDSGWGVVRRINQIRRSPKKARKYGVRYRCTTRPSRGDRKRFRHMT